MNDSQVTCWTLIRAAAAGDEPARAQFARVYARVARAALGARWSYPPQNQWIDDAAQDVFYEFLKSGGAFESIDQQRGDFRPFFFAIVRNVARRYEEKHRPQGQLPVELPNSDTSLSVAFDKAWARSLMKEAARTQAEMAQGNDRATKRLELLRLRFEEGLPIRTIAERCQADPGHLHHEYATARAEFRTALIRVIAFHHPGSSAAQLEEHCHELFAAVQAT